MSLSRRLVHAEPFGADAPNDGVEAVLAIGEQDARGEERYFGRACDGSAGAIGGRVKSASATSVAERPRNRRVLSAAPGRFQVPGSRAHSPFEPRAR